MSIKTSSNIDIMSDMPDHSHDIFPIHVIDTTRNTRSFEPETPPNLQFTKIIEANIGTERVIGNWTNLVRGCIKLALKENISIGRLQQLGIPVQKGAKYDNGYNLIQGTNISLQRVDASKT